MENNEFTREQIYNLVWSKPLSKLAAEFSISDNGLRKTCNRLNIPLPKNGHWQKVKFGKKVKQIKLPKDNKEYDPITLSKRTNLINYFDQKPVTILRKEIDKEHENQLIIPEKLIKPNILIRDAKRNLKSKKVKSYSNLKGVVDTDSGLLNMSVSPQNINRATILMDSFLKLLYARGHKIDIRGSSTFIQIKEEKIKFRLVEKFKKVIDNSGSYPRQELHANGSLSFKYEGSWRELEVKDSTGTKLEERISLIMAKLELLAEEERIKKIEREKRHQERLKEEAIQEEIKRRKKEEENKLESLLSNANLHFEANKIRNYINQLVESSESQGNLRNEIIEYEKWALKKADWIDPMVKYDDKILKEPRKYFK